MRGASIYGSARLRFHNQDSRGGVGGLSYLDEFKLKKHCEIVMRSLKFAKNMWQGLENLQRMWLKENHIGVLRSGSFIGLQSLTELELAFNELTHIEPGALAGLPQIKLLKLWYNNLTTLESNIFDPNDFLNTFGHPIDIDIRLESNPIECTESICWLRDAVPPEVDEYESNYYDYLYPPIEFPSGFSMGTSDSNSRESECASPWCWSSLNVGSLTALGIFCEEYQQDFADVDYCTF